MAFNLTWDGTGERVYEIGADRAVLYPYNAQTGSYETGVAWNGLISVTESEDGADPSEEWADNLKYIYARSPGHFTGSIEAYTYPDEFAECDGTKAALSGVHLGQQTRKRFGFSFRSRIGNDTDAEDHGYKIHIIWNASAEPSDREYSTVNESPEAMTFNWNVSAEPVEHDYKSYKPFASMTIDSTKIEVSALEQIERWLYGSGSTNPRLPSPTEILDLFRYTYHTLLDSTGNPVLDSDGNSILTRTVNFD